MDKEAKARIKINKLLEEAGWRFFDSDQGPANVLLENHVKLTRQSYDDLGEDFEQTAKGFIDFLLLDPNGFPFITLEAKAEDKNPLIGKEQARKYANSQNCRFVILSNGNQHYFWDIKIGNPRLISVFPRQEEVQSFKKFQPDPTALGREIVESDYIVQTQKPDYARDASWLDLFTRPDFIQRNNLRFLRPYQVKAVQAVQSEVKKNKDRFLFEMATGTGKTLVSAAIIKLFLRTSNARRVLFLVDRLELEVQADKAFKQYLKNDYKCVIYKERRDDWRHAEIVVSTVQTFLAKNRYKRLFKSDDFDLVISDEAHRSIGGNARAVFEYFIGYKLGLTATPKDYLKNLGKDINNQDPRELERRALLDTYRTFGCENGSPTFRYSLLDGVREGYLINPVVVDARTDITTQLLSDKGYAVVTETEEGKEQPETFVGRDFEHRFFSENTNNVFCKTFLDHALVDPINGEIGKTIVFCVSQNHAAKVAQILNEEAHKRFPGKYNSDFALQVTSAIPGAQQMTINFASNKLSGHSESDPNYRTSKTRVAVTVGMMATGYDCTDILNLCLMRPIFSPTDFIQIKGRGTRTHDFSRLIVSPSIRIAVGEKNKDKYKLFDFFANCEYFEKEFNYDEVLKLPRESSGGFDPPPPPPPIFEYESILPDKISRFSIAEVGAEGMRIDRMYFQRFEEEIKNDSQVIQKVQAGALDAAADHIEKTYFNKPEDYFDLDKLRKAIHSDRRVPLREMVEFIFGQVPYIKDKNEFLDDEFDKFDSRYMPGEDVWASTKTVFKAYVLDEEFRKIVESGNFANLNINPNGEAFRKIPAPLRKLIPEYIKDYVPLNQFA
ncbi:MAG: restriction endonuclease subunit R [Chloroflexi bacterium HGW-Chloroflexi-8]|nr:MAG: restriction endonuclease subunit R [Chloroflexi bacterium HGW-Chloroflexi-8]